MAFINHAARTICFKIVYCGAGLSGKTSHIQHLATHMGPQSAGSLISLASSTDRTLFFDFLPVRQGILNGYAVQFHLYAVPGQVFYYATRRVVMQQPDGIICVVDSQQERAEVNEEALNETIKMLADQGPDFEQTPILLAYNKRDLRGVCSVADLNERYNPSVRYPYFETTATTGQNVYACLNHVAKTVLQRFRRANDSIPIAEHMPPLEVSTTTHASLVDARVQFPHSVVFINEWNPLSFYLSAQATRPVPLDVRFVEGEAYDVQSLALGNRFMFGEGRQTEGIIWVRPKEAKIIELAYEVTTIPRVEPLYVAIDTVVQRATDDDMTMLAVLVLDVERSSPLFKVPRIAVMLMENLKALLATVVIALNGRINKAVGDAFLVVFNSASKAIQAARKLRILLSERNKSNLKHALHIKMGIDVGEVELRHWELQADSELFGACVVRATRLCDHARGDEIVVSRTVLDVVGEELLSNRFTIERRNADLRNVSSQEVYLLRDLE